MRKILRRLENKTTTFRGTLVRFGRDGSSFGGCQTLLLKRIKTDGRCVADHLWFDLDPFWRLHLCAGDVVEFEATVTPYIKGYLGSGNELIADFVQELDYGLENPTDARLVACAYPRGGERWEPLKARGSGSSGEGEAQDRKEAYHQASREEAGG